MIIVLADDTETTLKALIATVKDADHAIDKSILYNLLVLVPNRVVVV